MIKFRRVQLPIPRLIWRCYLLTASMFALTGWFWLLHEYNSTGMFLIQLIVVTLGMIAIMVVVRFTKDTSKIW